MIKEVMQEYAEQHIHFLQKVHPLLGDKKNIAAEVRAVWRGDGERFIKPFNFWRFDKKSYLAYVEWLSDILEEPVDIYYSLFDFADSGRINASNANAIHVLGVDFDNISFEENQKICERWRRKGLESITIFSGHGFQNLFLIDEECNDKDILSKFTRQLENKYPVDTKIVDPARLFRLPFTFNCKVEGERIETCILENTSKRYSLEAIGKALDIKLTNDFDNSVGSNDTIEIQDVQARYPSLNFEALPTAVKKMLSNTPKGVRNSTLLFLSSFLKNKMGLSRLEVTEVLLEWDKTCSPPHGGDFIVQEVNRLLNYEYRGTGAYGSDLASVFGFIDFDEFILDNKVIIPNKFIKRLDNIHKSAVLIFLSIKSVQQEEWTIDEISELTKLTKQTTGRYLKKLVEEGFVRLNRGNRRNREKDTYKVNFFDRNEGFSLIEKSTLRIMTHDPEYSLTNSEIKLYLVVHSFCKKNKKCIASQEYLATKIGLKQNRVSELFKSLQEKKWINKKNYCLGDKQSHCQYWLNF